MSTRGKPFEKGNTFGKGRPPGSHNKKSWWLQRMLLDSGPELLQGAIEDAKKGDPLALKICVERLVPRLKEVEQLPVEEARRLPPILRVRFVDSVAPGLSEADRIEPPPLGAGKSDAPPAPAETASPPQWLVDLLDRTKRSPHPTQPGPPTPKPAQPIRRTRPPKTSPWS